MFCDRNKTSFVGKYSQELLYRDCQFNKKHRRKKKEYGSLHFLLTVIRADPMTHFTEKSTDSWNGRIMSAKNNRTQGRWTKNGHSDVVLLSYLTTPAYFHTHPRIFRMFFQLFPKLKRITPRRNALPSHA